MAAAGGAPRGPRATPQAAESRALYGVAATFFLLAAYIGFEAVDGLIAGERPEAAPAEIVLATLALLIMPTLAYWQMPPVLWRCSR